MGWNRGRVIAAITEKGFLHNIHNYMEWDDFILSSYMKNYFRYFVLYNKKNGKTRVTMELIIDLGYDKPWLFNHFACSDENGLYEMIGMMSIDRYVERVKGEADFLKPSVDKYKQLKNLPDDSNPVIFYYEFKKEL